MKYLDAFRDPGAARALRARMAALGETLATAGRNVNVMEVCGTHTMAIARYGIRDVLPENVRLLSGPGCPVCVTEPGYVDAAVELARRGYGVATFGDMLNVPGSETTLARCRAEGAAVEVCYSPAAALELAQRERDREIVFLAVGFETTIPVFAAVLERARSGAVGNLSLLPAFKCIPPALRALRADPEIRIDGFLCPPHVSAIIGSRAYEPFAGPGGVPCVIAGFEPLDILFGLVGILEQLVAGEARVVNQYTRVVRPEGNQKAQDLIARYFEPVDAAWRGLGVVPASGLRLRAEVADRDAARRAGIEVRAGREDPRCRCGDVIKAKCRPRDCALFGTACTPDQPVGPCMVSSEGTCAAAFKYER